MANSVNGVTTLTNGVATSSDNAREITNIDAWCYGNPYKGQVLQARLALDTAETIIIDDPRINRTNEQQSATSSLQRIYVVGVTFAVTAAMKITIQSKVGTASAKTLAAYDFAAKGGIDQPIMIQNPKWVTDQGGKLQVVIASVSATEYIEIYYVMADSLTKGS